MFELKKIINNTFVIENPSNMGVYKINKEEVLLIDSGNDKEAGKKIKNLLEEHNLKIKYIYNTHSHADHIGGNNYLQKYYNCEIFNSKLESIFTNEPNFEPIFLYGSLAPKNLQKKFLLAEKSLSNVLTNENIIQDIDIINLPGHTYEMIGFITKDNVAFIADSLLSENVLKKYPISFLFDIEKQLETLDYLKNLKCEYYIGSHFKPCKDITSLIEFNRGIINNVILDILNICSDPVTFDNLLKKLFDKYSIVFSYEQYFIVGSTLKAYLSYLIKKNKLTFVLNDNLLFYKTI